MHRNLNNKLSVVVSGFVQGYVSSVMPDLPSSLFPFRTGQLSSLLGFYCSLVCAYGL